MPDYGHDLRFGTFLTPQNAAPDQVVALAQLSEELGYDLVTFQDHPYQPAFLDTWTLLSYVAARTTRVHLAPNVLNLPLRNPAVIARSVASLDLLSGGRIDLGLGAGAFWEAIEAMGGPKLTPGQSVAALAEALDVIRGIWAVDQRGGLFVPGEFHSATGAKRGPAPAHDVPIWLGAYKPRMLRLIGEKADGWLPSLSYLQPGDLARGNAVIDEAALAAGREPRDVRRLLNVLGGQEIRRPEEWLDQLLPLALEDGISTFILGTDDPRRMQEFAEEVIPALREEVAAERVDAPGTAMGGRSARALSRRAPGIDYDAIPPSLAADAVEPADPTYGRVRHSYVHRGSPGLVLRPADTAQVAEAVAYARRQQVPFVARSGGHGIGGSSTNDGGIVVDLGRLKTVEVLDRARRIVRLGVGLRWREVARELAPYGLAISSGDSGDVGVGGLATSGGIGLLARSYGLTVDHVVSADVVLADGTVVRADADHHPDLLWAVRGGGEYVGVVTSLDIEAMELSDVVLAVIVHEVDDTADYLARLGSLTESTSRLLTPFTTVFPAGDSQTYARIMLVWAGDDTETAVGSIEPFLHLAPVVQQQAQVAPYKGIIGSTGDPTAGHVQPPTRSALVAHLDDGVVQKAGRMMDDGRLQMMQVRAFPGAAGDVTAEATAFAHRDRAYSVLVVAAGDDSVDAEWDGVVDALYGNFETVLTPETTAKTFPPATLARLREVKANYDPDGVLGRTSLGD
ncbi:LLM class flavin-dependent oxidoreductase [Mumia sp. ZJ1417]|uniref:LLM class flavin-dependent oxidoreductase n=1 Tax=Mumia sp. ZJ1417 TaxID=2708082 RepID=UPI00141F2A7E|nr:LLM class flavin-dependent oxidoreductase [Mumia sp. ZJ1417]QMW67540.1 LLM class flavin-dependent oxidoreductase [Mumia sp. ZJ1417]